MINFHNKQMITFFLKSLAHVYHWSCSFSFQKVHEHSHAGLQIAQNVFSQIFCFPFLQKRLSTIILDCIDCQMHKYKKMNQNKAAIFPFSKLSIFFNHCFFTDNYRPLNPAAGGNFLIFVLDDHFTNYILSEPTPKNNSHFVVKAIFHHCFSKFGPF